MSEMETYDDPGTRRVAAAIDAYERYQFLHGPSPFNAMRAAVYAADSLAKVIEKEQEAK